MPFRFCRPTFPFLSLLILLMGLIASFGAAVPRFAFACSPPPPGPERLTLVLDSAWVDGTPRADLAAYDGFAVSLLGFYPGELIFDASDQASGSWAQRYRVVQ